jgi:hypothetical protein
MITIIICKYVDGTHYKSWIDFSQHEVFHVTIHYTSCHHLLNHIFMSLTIFLVNIMSL